MDIDNNNVTYIDIDKLIPAEWNANVTPPEIMAKIEYSISTYGQLENLVVRPIVREGTDKELYEVISGNHRLKILKKRGYEKVMCLVVDLSDTDARLVAQAMNRLGGQDDINKKAELYKFLIQNNVEKSKIIALLPENENKIEALLKMSEMKMSDMFENLKDESDTVQMTIIFTKEQWSIINTALQKFSEVEDVHYKNLKAKFFEYLSADYLAGSDINETEGK